MNFYKFSWTLAAIFFLFAFYYLCLSFWVFRDYQSYDRNLLLHPQSVTVVKNHTYHYQLKIAYTYTVEGQSYFQEQILAASFINPWSAELEKKQLLKSGLKIYFSNKTPGKGDINARLPIKEGVYGILLFLVAIYLLFLSRYSRHWF